MIKQKMTKYENEVGSMAPYGIIKTLSKKNLGNWILEHEQRLMVAASMMNEMGIGKRIYEFHDADFVNNKRVKTFSDYLNTEHEPTIVAKNLETGNFDGINTFYSKHGHFGDLFEYVTGGDISKVSNNKNRTGNNLLAYNFIDSVVFDNYYPRLVNYLKAAVALGKDCYLPITGYKDSKYVKKEILTHEEIKKLVSLIPNITTEETESYIAENDSFVKVLKISKSK